MGSGDKALVGIGGWLATFIFVTAAWMPFRTIKRTISFLSEPDVATVFGDTFPLVSGGAIAVAAITTFGGWYLAWRLLMVETWRTVQIVIAGIWILNVVLRLPAPALLIWLFESEGANFPLLPILYLTVPSLLLAIGWTAYFLLSKRVANTYSRDPYARRLSSY